MKRVWMLGLVFLLGLSVLPAQEQPLINYAAGIGEMEHDEDPEGRGDGVADGFSWGVSPSSEASVFVPSKDLTESVSGSGSQRISFSRNNSSGNATAGMTLLLRFPSSMYPQPGETVRISFWLKTANWQNARYRAIAADANGGNSAILLSSTTPINEWTRFEYTYIIRNVTPNGLRLTIEFTALTGLSQGTAWIDNIEVYGSKRWEPHVNRSMKLFTYYRDNAALANGDWIYYARNFDMVGTFNSTVDLRRMKVYHPELRTLTYYIAFYSVDTVPWPARDPFGYAYCNANHPDWFAMNVLGQRVRRADQYLMDVGVPECADWAVNNMRTRAQRANMGWDGIQLDSLIDFTNGFNLARYPTPASRIAATKKYLMKINQGLSEYGTEIIANAASAAYTRNNIHTLLLNEGYLQGMLIEQAFTNIFSLPSEYLSVGAWEGQLVTLASHPDKLRVVYSGYSANPQRARPMKLYALASFMLISGETAFLYLDVHYYENGVNGQRAWRPDEDFDVPLGQPTGPYEVYFRSTDYTGGLYYRPFENGFVLVNPTGATRVVVPSRVEPLWKDGATFTWTLDDTYWELVTQTTYPAGTRIKLYPKQARIFIRQNSGALRDYPPANRPPKGTPPPLNRDGGLRR
ncbi:MAG: putative glycoside hydrolase [Fimbriimonadales bacterium]